MTGPEKDLESWIEKEFFNAAPVFVAALDRDLNIIHANKAFHDKFGEWKGKKCFNVYKKQDAVCDDCTSRLAFSTDSTSVSKQTGVSRNGRLIHYIKYAVPVTDKAGQVTYLVEVSTETTQFKKIETEFKLLFEQVPCNIIIINKDFKVIRANKKAENMIGNLRGENCFSVLKGRTEQCLECTARKTFEDGLQHTGHHTWNLSDGRTAHMHVITILLKGETPDQDLVMEMAVDISRTINLQNRLEDAHDYLQALINTSMDGIVGISRKGKVEVFNTAARSLFHIAPGQVVSLEDINAMLPKGFLARVSKEKGHVYLPEVEMQKSNGKKFLGRLIGNRLKDAKKRIGMAFSVHDISQLKRLEQDKIEAERMAIVGQTVAGLAHGIKNLINALDGGMYFLKSGISNGDAQRVHKGIETLARNIVRIRSFSMAFLNYARFREIKPLDCDPADIIQEVIESFAAKAEEKNIRIFFKQDQKLAPVFLDYEKIHEALTNLIGNAVDAFTDVADTRDKVIMVRLSEEEGTIFIEVEDNACGIDEEQRGRIFQKFFTTKGLEGTGLGLLMTKKIIQEHGGHISVTSKKSEGSVFRIKFLRGRLPKHIE